MLKLEKEYQNINKSEWEDLILRSNYANIFQTPKMYNFWLKQENVSPKICAGYLHDKLVFIMISTIMKEKGKVKGFLSRRAVIYGGPIIDDSLKENGEVLQKILVQASTVLKKNAIYSEIRNCNDYSDFKVPFTNTGWNYNPHLNFHVDCTSIDLVKKNISKSKVRQIKKSINTGAEIVQASSEKEVIEFYEILENLYIGKVKKPLLPIDFFLDFFRSDIGVYLLVRYSGKIIGGILCPILGKKVIYEWFVCGEDGVYENIYPSILATWAAIEYACKNGIERFDFMGAGKPDEEYGVREFKSKFGGCLVEHGRFVKIHNEILYNIGKTGLKIYQKVK